MFYLAKNALSLAKFVHTLTFSCMAGVYSDLTVAGVARAGGDEAATHKGNVGEGEQGLPTSNEKP